MHYTHLGSDDNCTTHIGRTCYVVRLTRAQLYQSSADSLDPVRMFQDQLRPWYSFIVALHLRPGSSIYLLEAKKDPRERSVLHYRYWNRILQHEGITMISEP